MWEEHFLAYFAEQGYAAHALSLRGHGGSDEPDNMHLVGLADYVDDLNEAVLRLGATPILIGHSLGGIVVQKWLKHHEAPGVVLMGSGPPHGMLPSSLRMLFRDPRLAMEIALAQAFGPDFASVEPARKMLFSDSLSATAVRRHFARSSGESLRVGFELAWPDLPYPAWDRELPILVLGAENDFFISPTMVAATARIYRTRAEIFPEMAHAMMLEPGWREVADRIARWIEERVAADGPAPGIARGSARHRG